MRSPEEIVAGLRDQVHQWCGFYPADDVYDDYEVVRLVLANIVMGRGVPKEWRDHLDKEVDEYFKRLAPKDVEIEEPGSVEDSGIRCPNCESGMVLTEDGRVCPNCLHEEVNIF